MRFDLARVLVYEDRGDVAALLKLLCSFGAVGEEVALLLESGNRLLSNDLLVFVAKQMDMESGVSFARQVSAQFLLLA